MYILKLLEGILSGSCTRKRLYCSQDGCWGRSGRSRVSPLVPAEPAVGYSSLLLQSAFLSQVPDSISHALEVQLGEIKSNLLWSWPTMYMRYSISISVNSMKTTNLYTWWWLWHNPVILWYELQTDVLKYMLKESLNIGNSKGEPSNIVVLKEHGKSSKQSK